MIASTLTLDIVSHGRVFEAGAVTVYIDQLLRELSNPQLSQEVALEKLDAVSPNGD
jgi:hypothetical protein